MSRRLQAACRGSVTIVQKSLPEYRVALFDALRERLAEQRIALRVVYGHPGEEDALRNDTVDLAWGEIRESRRLRIGRRTALWQPVVDTGRVSDLVIVEQAAKLVVNYALLALQAAGIARIAFWGHGANFQVHRAHPVAEAVKRRVSRWPHWWFAYTEESRRRVEALGYPAERITVVQNATDTLSLRKWRSELRDETIAQTRSELGLASGPIAATLGGLYEEKRLAFLLEACDQVKVKWPDFELLVVGDGPARDKVERLAAHRDYVHLLGARFRAEKVRLLSPASVLLIPGLVGLTVIDSFALELPLVTTAIDYHSPEIEYLSAGENGVVVGLPEDVSLYAQEVVALLEDSQRLAHLREGCRRAAERYTLEAMVARFTEGITAALEAPRRAPTLRLTDGKPARAR